MKNINEETLKYHYNVSFEKRDLEVFKNLFLDFGNDDTVISFDYLDNIFFKYYLQILDIYLNIDNPTELNNILGRFKYDIGYIDVKFVEGIKFESNNKIEKKFISEIYNQLCIVRNIYRSVSDYEFTKRGFLY